MPSKAGRAARAALARLRDIPQPLLQVVIILAGDYRLPRRDPELHGGALGAGRAVVVGTVQHVLSEDERVAQVELEAPRRRRSVLVGQVKLVDAGALADQVIDRALCRIDRELDRWPPACALLERQEAGDDALVPARAERAHIRR